MPKVSVIVTTYNRKDFLTETLNGILNQTFSDFELIVVDNFSNYDFFEHIKSFNDSRILPFQNQNNGIIAINRNIGIKYAKGQFLAFCDDDDIWIDTKLEIQLKKIKKSGSDLICSNLLIFEGVKSNILCKTKNRKTKGINDLLIRNQVFTSTVVVKNSKELFFSEDIQLVAIEDYGLWIKLFSSGYKFEFIDDALVYYRKAPISPHIANYLQKHLKFIYLYRNFLKTNPKSKQKVLINLLIPIHIIKFVIKMGIKKLNFKRVMNFN